MVKRNRKIKNGGKKKMEKISKLYRQADWYRPLFVTLENGDEVQLNSIVVYDENGIVVQSEYGYFDNDKIRRAHV